MAILSQASAPVKTGAIRLGFEQPDHLQEARSFRASFFLYTDEAEKNRLTEKKLAFNY